MDLLCYPLPKVPPKIEVRRCIFILNYFNIEVVLYLLNGFQNCTVTYYLCSTGTSNDPTKTMMETSTGSTTTEVNQPCEDKKLSNLSSTEAMEEGGWIFSVELPEHSRYAGRCGTDTWFGHTGDWGKGSVSACFKGNGNATLIFGNCWYYYEVDVYLNHRQISTAYGNETRKEVHFHFTRGDNLRLEEAGALIKFHSLHISC